MKIEQRQWLLILCGNKPKTKHFLIDKIYEKNIEGGRYMTGNDGK